MKARAETFSGRKPDIYRGISEDIKKNVFTKADASYKKSPALEILLNSAEYWNISGDLHSLELLSTDYANYRQYGCGGIPIVKIIVIEHPEINQFVRRFNMAFSVR